MQEINREVMNITGGARAAHAFMIEGRAGGSRDAFITRLAQGLECTCAEPGGRPCLRCPACRQITAGTSLDVVYMNKSTGSGKTARATYKVEDAAAFIERLSMVPYGRYLIGIIQDADSLSEVVQNKLLKTLEEPRENTILLLGVTNRDNLLETVRSRCSLIRADIAISEEFPEAGEDETKTLAKLREVSRMMISSDCAFYEFREALESAVKSRDDALLLIEMIEDELREIMRGVVSGTSVTALQAAEYIEYTAAAGMDIRRDMNHTRALKRLRLEINR